MNTHSNPIRPALTLALLLIPAAAASAGVATSPFAVTYQVNPLVMFALSNDHQLYKKAYNDYSDLNDDGTIDTTYNNAYDYLGYFASDMCYAYEANTSYTTPAGGSTTGLFVAISAAADHQCSGTWSGNLLNWASTTRMDLLRKVLYGGYRFTDTTAETILERVLLPTDVHAFAKVFAPAAGAAEMARYTPYSTNERINAITFCNVTWATSGESQSLDTTASPPLIRVARNQWPMWASGEVVECAWREAVNNPTAPYGKDQTSSSYKDEFKARVKVCAPGLEEDNCGRYTSNANPPVVTVKPRGLLQEYGEDGRLRFGLISGSYTKNKSGGVLRRNVAPLAGTEDAAGNPTPIRDEINLQTGQFTGNAGIIKTIDTFRINKYDFAARKYKDGCDTYGILSFTDGKCTNWGNPISEIQLEALRYFAGKTGPTDAFAGDDRSGSYGTYFSGLAPVTWSEPMPASEWCARCNIVILSTGVNSFDRDQLTSKIDGLDAAARTTTLGLWEGIPGGNTYVLGGSSGQCSAKTIAGLADAQGICPDGPSLLGGFHVAGLAHYAHDNDLRPADRKGDQFVFTRAVALARDLPRFQVAVGDRTITLLPHAEAISNSDATRTSSGWRAGSLVDLIIERLDKNDQGQLIGGRILALWEDSTWGNDYDMDGIARLEFCVGAKCSEYDQAYSSSNTNYGAAASNELRVATSVQHVYAGNSLLFGFTVTGTNNGSTPSNTLCDGAWHGDGVYREVIRKGSTGNFSLLSNPQDNPSRKPADCVRRFSAGTTAAKLLENPLWYAAKYGSYNDSDYDGRPDRDNEWDAKPVDEPDGQPDGFFFADNPAELGQSLTEFLEVISTTSSSASVAANSITLNLETKIYQARYDSGDWSGDLVAFPVNGDGTLAAQSWSARNRLDGMELTSRRIITTNADSRTGVPFRWGDVTSNNADGIAGSQKRDLCPSCTVDTTPLNTALGEARLNWLRGDQSNEVGHGDLDLRPRRHLLGDLVNSEPIYIGVPEANLPLALEAASYPAFAEAPAQLTRPHMLYLGGNDGMLHGFAAATGSEVFGYVPRAIYPKLPLLTQIDYHDRHQYFVDGGPTAGDAYLGEAKGWRTVLASGLGGGGAGMFALDITSPTALQTSETSAAARVLWDLTGTDAGFTDLGYTFSKPAIIRLPDTNHGGRWAVAFGNGFADDAGRAVLYIVDAATGARLSAVVAQDSLEGKPNGLASVAPVDYDGDARVDFIYAGDLQGNLWRFEPTTAADGACVSGGWKVSYSASTPCVPLFNTAEVSSQEEVVVQHPVEVCEWVLKNPGEPALGSNYVCHTEYKSTTETVFVPGATQPITVRPEVMRHPDEGTLVLFGTGSYYRTEDQTPHPEVTHNFFAVWDRDVPPAGAAGIRRWHLLRQNIVEEQRVGQYDVRVTSSNPITWHEGSGTPEGTPPTTHLGWYLELTSPGNNGHQGEQQVTEPILRGGRIIFTTLIPSTLPCDFSGDGWLTELNALDGQPITEILFDLDGDQDFDTNDLATITVDGQTTKITPSAKKSKVAVIQEPAIVAAGTKEYKFTSGAKDAGIEVTTENGSPNNGGRRSWVELH